MSWVAKVNSLRNALYLSASCLLLGGCETIYGWANGVGSYMPVIGDRCEHWQCVTSEGQAISEAKKRQQAEMEGMPASENKTDDEEDESGSDASSSDAKRPNVFTEERPPIIPPSTESGVPEVEQRGSRKPFPKQF